MRLFALLLLAGLSFPVLSPAQEHYQYPFQNPNLPTEQRIDNLLSLMTLQEKIDALSTDPDVPRLGVHGSGQIEGLARRRPRWARWLGPCVSSRRQAWHPGRSSIE